VNRQAIVTLLRAGEWPVNAEREGMTFEEAHSRAVVHGLEKMAASASNPAQRTAIEALHRAVTRASDLEGTPRPIAIVQAGPEMTHAEMLAAQQEEWDHILGIRLGGGTLEGLVDDYESLRQMVPDEIAKAERALAKSNYDEPAHYPHEIFVRLLRGRMAEFGLSPEESARLAVAYGKVLLRTHGERADEIVDTIYRAHELENSP
jgi:hypothetical protein